MKVEVEMPIPITCRKQSREKIPIHDVHMPIKE